MKWTTVIVGACAFLAMMTRDIDAMPSFVDDSVGSPVNPVVEGVSADAYSSSSATSSDDTEGIGDGQSTGPCGGESDACAEDEACAACFDDYEVVELFLPDLVSCETLIDAWTMSLPSTCDEDSRLIQDLLECSANFLFATITNGVVSENVCSSLTTMAPTMAPTRSQD
jgi:hypothetical protein